MAEIRVPYRSPESIQNVAKDCLAKHNPEAIIPVPVELILERDFGINIVPIPGMLETAGVKAHTSANLSQISVDHEHLMQSLPQCRFTLAHELGHIVLHPEIYALARHRSTCDYLAFVEGFPKDQYSYMETQANYFAGFFVAPQDALREAAANAIERFKEFGVEDPALVQALWQQVEEFAAEDLGLTRFPVGIRMNYDGTQAWALQQIDSRKNIARG